MLHMTEGKYAVVSALPPKSTCPPTRCTLSIMAIDKEPPSLCQTHTTTQQAKRTTFNKRMGQQVRDRLKWVVKRRHM